MKRRRFLGGAAAGVAMLAAPAIGRAQGAAIRIGEVNSYTVIPAFLAPYKNGWQMAEAEINGAGGVLGRKMETLFRDDGGKPENAVRLAGELLDAEKVEVLAGGFLSNVGLALSDFAREHQRLYMAGEPLTDALVWSKGNLYTFRLRPSTYMQSAMLVEEAAKLPAKRWAIVTPNYEYGQSAAQSFKALLQKARPDVQFVAEQYPALGKIDAGATVDAVAAANPEAIFNVTFGPDLTSFVRQGNTRGLFEKRAVVSLLTGEPEYLDALKDETPAGWIVTGYPWADIKTPEHAKFREAYQKQFSDYPRLGSVVGYTAAKVIAEAIRKAGKTDTQALIAALRGMRFESPIGAAEFRAIDHQSTLGAYIGKTALKDG
ncbi:MAG TPA: ABC transporter substrate-binding protein, partial [Stellaceae bacterium]|nr:ABC transporter substrate-binding protein [Stellaceae bacterium]